MESTVNHRRTFFCRFSLAIAATLCWGCETERAAPTAAPVKAPSDSTSPPGAPANRDDPPPVHAAKDMPPASPTEAPTAVEPAPDKPAPDKPSPSKVTALTEAFGFNWFRAADACVPIGAAKLASLASGAKPCTLNEEPPFGDAEPKFQDAVSFTCPVDKRTEWLIFASKPACQDQLETMQANGP